MTGAGRGLGRAHALALAGAGASVVVNDIGAALDGSGRDDTPAAAVVAEIESLGGRAVADGTDIASVDGGARAVANTIAAFGRIDILVNNAGFAHGGGDVDAPIDGELDALLAVHFKAAVGTMSAAFVDMRARQWGRIINTVSEVALDARVAGALGYGAAKAALWSATLTAARAGAASRDHGQRHLTGCPHADERGAPRRGLPWAVDRRRPQPGSRRPRRRLPRIRRGGRHHRPDHPRAQGAHCVSTRRRARHGPTSSPVSNRLSPTRTVCVRASRQRERMPADEHGAGDQPEREHSELGGVEVLGGPSHLAGGGELDQHARVQPERATGRRAGHRPPDHEPLRCRDQAHVVEAEGRAPAGAATPATARCRRPTRSAHRGCATFGRPVHGSPAARRRRWPPWRRDRPRRAATFSSSVMLPRLLRP